MAGPVVTSRSVKLLGLTPVTGSLNLTLTMALLGTSVPVGMCETRVGEVRSAVTPQRPRMVALTTLAGAMWVAPADVAVSRRR